MRASIVACLLALSGCSANAAPEETGVPSSDHSALPSGSVAASPETTAALGVDQWKVSNHVEDDGTQVIKVVGYDEAQSLRTQVGWRKQTDGTSDWIDFAVASQPPASLRLEKGRVPDGVAAFRANGSATEVIAHLRDDLASASTSGGIQPKDLVNAPQDVLTHAHYMTLCLGSPYHNMTYDECNQMYYGP